MGLGIVIIDIAKWSFWFALIPSFLFALVSALIASFILVKWWKTVISTNSIRRDRLLRALDIDAKGKKIVGFFHPYCNAGGGGERVLWTAIAYLQRTEPSVVSIVYTGDTDATKEQIISKVRQRFGITLDPRSLYFVYLQSRHFVEDKTYPRFTLLGQSLGSMWLVREALEEVIPDVFIDTMGYAFTFYVVRWMTSSSPIPIAAYVHYPTISSTMLHRVKSRESGHTNSGNIASSSVLSRGKLLYYEVFAYLYTSALRQANHIMVNSTWTKNHVDALLSAASISSYSKNRQTTIVYPPCDTTALNKFSLTGRQRVVLSLAQFRPEKEHDAQLRALKILFEKQPSHRASVKLVLVGSSRNSEDAARVDKLKALAKELKIESNVEFVLNAEYPVLLSWLQKASVGINSMVEEHFGINVVEFMAAGLIPVVHKSGGPLYDIVVAYNGEPTGYHAKTPDEFADAIHTALTLPAREELAMRKRARALSSRFSATEFEKGFGSVWKDVAKPLK